MFLFFHDPQGLSGPMRQVVRVLCDPAKTTIFNGHWHHATYSKDAGIPVYVLAATGAETDDDYGPDLGYLHLFAHVAVSGGAVTVALEPMDALMPGEQFSREFSDACQKLAEGELKLSPTTDAAGRGVLVRQSNPTGVEVRVECKWIGQGVTAKPAEANWTLQPGRKPSKRSR